MRTFTIFAFQFLTVHFLSPSPSNNFLITIFDEIEE